MLAVALPLRAESITDDFNRANTSQGNGGLGADWNITGEIFLHENHAITHYKGEALAVYAKAKTSGEFSVACDFYALANRNYAGVVFHFIDAKNYQVLRVSFSEQDDQKTVWQWLKFTGGKMELTAQGAIPAGNMPVKQWRRLSLQSDGKPGAYRFKVTDRSGDTQYAAGALQGGDAATGGQCGFYFGNAYQYADNFNLESGQ